MSRRSFPWFVSIAVVALASCNPSIALVRPTMDSGPPLDVAPASSDSAMPPTDANGSCGPSASDAASTDAHDPRAPDFALVLVERPTSITRGDTATLRVRIERAGDFDAPVLIDLWGLPDTLWAQARESRVGDDVIELTIEASEDAVPVEDTAFAVQASARGIRRIERTTISVR